MVQGGGMKKLAKKEQKSVVKQRLAKHTKKGKRAAPNSEKWSKAKKKLQGVYTAALEANLVQKMAPSEKEKLRVIVSKKFEKLPTKAEKKALARKARRGKKKGSAAAILADNEAAGLARGL
ncbi:hypothetical protein DIPPA_35028 [Diplonema papillatum]|nr:hypothetical protein DIPPA_35028 [Diplonema papillatum]